MATTPKQLKLGTDKMVLGVISGFAEYFNVDVTLARVIFALFTIITSVFPGAIFYLVAYWVMKEAEKKA